jgi:hypothetical protein
MTSRSIEAAALTMTVGELAKAAGPHGQLWIELGGERLKIDGADVIGESVVLWSESPVVDLADRIQKIESQLIAMRQKVSTETLEVVDRRGRPHVVAYAGDEFGSVSLIGRAVEPVDDGPSVTITASVEGETEAYLVARVGDIVIASVGTEQP